MQNNDIRRMKEIMTHYQDTKKKLQAHPLNASLRGQVSRIKEEVLKELETLIERL